MRLLTLEATKADEAEAAWISQAAYDTILGRALVNAALLRPKSAFAAYFAALQGTAGGRDARSRRADEVLAAQGGDRREAMVALEESSAVEACGMFRLHSRANHSCAPTAEARSFGMGDATFDFVTKEAVKKGGELLISYVDPKLPRARRQQILRTNYAFDCNCSRCSQDTELT